MVGRSIGDCGDEESGFNNLSSVKYLKLKFYFERML